jgi:hypothetical protein
MSYSHTDYLLDGQKTYVVSERRQLAVDALCPVISLEHVFTGPGTGTHTKWQDQLFLLNAMLSGSTLKW